MRFEPIEPPRRFLVGARANVELKDCGRVSLEPDEQLTLTTERGAEYDITRKEWGFYATPSLNMRLLLFGLRAVLAASADNRYFVLFVERGGEDAFDRYRAEEGLRVVAWLDSTEALERVDQALTRT
jgi:hypothetical protein